MRIPLKSLLRKTYGETHALLAWYSKVSDCEGASTLVDLKWGRLLVPPVCVLRRFVHRSESEVRLFGDGWSELWNLFAALCLLRVLVANDSRELPANYGKWAYCKSVWWKEYMNTANESDLGLQTHHDLVYGRFLFHGPGDGITWLVFGKSRSIV